MKIIIGFGGKHRHSGSIPLDVGNEDEGNLPPFMYVS